MNKIIFISLAVFSLLYFSCNEASENTNESKKQESDKDFTQNPNLKLQIYYFHSSKRCAGCNSIENGISEVVETNFKNELNKGVIDFKVLNIDKKENTEIAEKYLVYGASLKIIQISEGKETPNDFTQYGFTYARTQPDFFKENMTDTINQLLM